MMSKRNIGSEENEIRSSQLLTPFGIGALTDINNQSVMISDSRSWIFYKDTKFHDRDTKWDTEFHDIRLQRALKADGFIEPPTGQQGKVRTKLFPTWYFCPSAKTRDLATLSEWKKRMKKRGISLRDFERTLHFLKNGDKELVPVRIICVCEAGHVQDFPWYEWAHSGQHMDPSKSKKHELSLKNVGSSGTIADMRVECSCGCQRSLKGIFGSHASSKLEAINVSCKGLYGWKDEDKGEPCEKELKPILRNANNFYFPNLISSVNIPFKENAEISDIQNIGDYHDIQRDLMYEPTIDKKIDALNNSPRTKDSLQAIANKLKCDVDEIREQLIKNLEKTDETPDRLTETDYRQDEYDVLVGEKTYKKTPTKFDIKIYSHDSFPSKESFSSTEFFSHITLLNQMEVVNVLKSYSRIRPIEREEILEQEKIESGMAEPNEIGEVSLRRKEDNIFVGKRNNGEGIFVSLDPKKLDEWRKRIKDTSFERRILNKKKNQQLSPYLSALVAPAFYLVHTISHLLINELSFTCGYSSSALRERLYYSNDAEKGKMCGFLIYTSSADSEGTLGGLVRQGVPENFFNIFESALEKARWCSYDPTCIESRGQGRDSLNLAACHACVLTSETSCERLNLLLDRGMLIGTLEDPELGFFSKLVND